MIPFFRRVLRLFAYDEAFFERFFRSILMGLAGGGIAFGDQLATIVGLPGWGRAAKVAGIVAGAISLMVAAGQKNAPEQVSLPAPEAKETP